MKSLILKVAVRVLFPLLIITSLLSLFRGHNEPGGGFIGGLVASIAFILLTFAIGVKETINSRHIQPTVFIIVGLGCALFAALLPMMHGSVFFDAMWADFSLPVIGRPGTPLLFDAGVYFVVIGAVCKIIFAIAD
jgi:multicomponent Na+:H+ antiporter subunit B